MNANQNELTPGAQCESAKADSQQRVVRRIWRVSIRHPIASKVANRHAGQEAFHLYIESGGCDAAKAHAVEMIKKWMLATAADEVESWWATRDGIVTNAPNEKADRSPA